VGSGARWAAGGATVTAHRLLAHHQTHHDAILTGHLHVGEGDMRWLRVLTKPDGQVNEEALPYRLTGETTSVIILL
jgi:hypothetical protein